MLHLPRNQLLALTVSPPIACASQTPFGVEVYVDQHFAEVDANLKFDRERAYGWVLVQ